MERGEIACYERFLLFPQCFQKACLPRASKGVIVWEWVKYTITSFIESIFIQAISPGLFGTVPDFDTLSRHPGKYEIVPDN